ncbi:MAG: DUF4340 domain-containing protein [Porcipelethomonas sp.]
MKRIRNAAVILAVIIVAAVGIFLAASYFSGKQAEEEEAAAEELVLFNFNSDDVDKVEIHGDDGDYTAEYVYGTGWVLADSDEFELNSTAISAIAAGMCDLNATRILNDDDKSKYGFDSPVKITAYTGSQSYTVLVGDPTPTRENYYVMKEDDDRIYLVDYSVGLNLCPTKDSLKETYIFTYLYYNIDHFALWEGKESDENVLFSMSKDSSDVWTMEKPYNDGSVYLTQVDEFLTDAAKDQISTFVQEGCTEADYSKYGFDDPRYVFEISAGDEHKKIIFGDYNEDKSEMYGLFVESGQVVTFIPNEIALLGYSTMDMMNTSVFTADISDVSKVTVDMPDASAELTIAGGDETSYTLNSKNVSKEGDEAIDKFETFFNSFNNAYFETVETDSQPEGEAEISIEYTLTNNIVTRIEYIPVPGSETYWAMKDGEYTGFVVREKIISNIISCYDTLTEMMEGTQ